MKRFCNILFLGLVGLSLGAQQPPPLGFDLSTESSGSIEKGFRQQSEIWLDARGLLAESDLWDRHLEARAEARWNIEWSSQAAQARLKLRLDSVDIAEHPERLLEEAWGRWSAEGWSLQAGLLKPVWGRADALRVLDVLNPVDRRNFVLDPLLDQKISQPMLRLVLEPHPVLRFETVWTPWLEGDRIATEGIWAPRQMRDLLAGADSQFYQQYRTAIEAQAYASAYAFFMTATGGNHALSVSQAQAKVASQQQEIANQARKETDATMARFLAYPDQLRWENSQIGVRLNLTSPAVDFGFQYWYGFLRLPSYDLATVAANGNRLVFSYDRVHHLGLDVATTLLGFGIRAEAALDATSDLEGDNPRIHNPSLAWSLGIDREVAGLRWMLEGRQRLLLFFDNITKSTDLEKDSNRTETLGLLRLQQGLFQDTLNWELAVLYGFEEVNAAVLPKISKSFDDLEVELSGFFALGRDDRGLLSQFYENRLVRLRVGYRF